MRTLRQILADRTSGAATLYRQTLDLFLAGGVYADSERCREAVSRLQAAFPEMAVFRYLEKELTGIKGTDPGKTARRLRREVEEEIGLIIERVSRIWKTKRRVVTFSQSSVVREILLAQKRKVAEVILSLAAPGNEGIIMARKLARSGLAVSICTDAALPGLVRKNDLVLLGADCLSEDFFVNKTGTFGLVLAARNVGAKIAVVSERFKFLSSKEYGFPAQQHPKREVLARTTRKTTVYNAYYEKIPLSLVTFVVTGGGATFNKKAGIIHIPA